MHSIVKSLLATFIIATVLAIGANCAVYAYMMQGIKFAHADTVIKIAGATLLLTGILLVLSLPALFLMNHKFWKPAIIGFLLYFAGPVIFVVAFVFMQMEPTDQLLGQLTGLIYLAVTTFFYYLVTKDHRKKFGKIVTLSASERLSSRINPL